MHMDWRVGKPFLLAGSVAVIAGGFLAAYCIRHPASDLIWLSAYLVLVFGVAQIVFGGGQGLLCDRSPRDGWVAAEWVVFNLGNLGVIIGTLSASFPLVLGGTILFVTGIGMFLAGTRGRVRPLWLAGYRALLGLIFISSLVGLALAAVTRVG